MRALARENLDEAAPCLTNQEDTFGALLGGFGKLTTAATSAAVQATSLVKTQAAVRPL